MSDGALRDLVGQLRSRRINRRQFIQGTAALGVSATAVSGALRSMPSARAQATELTMWTTFTAQDLANIQAVVDGYNAQSTGAQVKLVGVPPAQVTDVTKLMTAVRGGTGPDIYLLDRFIVAQNAATGLLQDLSALGADDFIGNYVPFAQAEASYNGKVYALPFDTDARALYYNKTMLSSVGVDPTELDQANGPVTWARIGEIANMLNVQDANGNYTQMGFIPWLNQGWHYTYGFSWGGQFFDQANCEVSPDDPPIVAAFQWVQDYCKALGADKVNAFGSPSMQPGFDPAQHPFHIASLAMQITGDWEIAQLTQYAPDLDYGITYMPVPNAGDTSVTWAGGWSVVIPEGAKNVDDAWTALQWIGGAPGSEIYTTKSSHLSTVSSVIAKPELFEGEHNFFAQMLPTAKNRPPLPVGAKYWDELTVAWQKTYLGESAPADALADVKEHVNADLKQYCPITMVDNSAPAAATPSS
jgi:multiple sugar transport system substrate-binding protein